MQIENGTYAANPTGRSEVGEHENGCLIVAMEFAGECGTISNTFWLTTKDGAVNTKTVESLKEVFGWDGVDPFWFEDNNLSDIPVEIVIENEQFTGKDGEVRIAPKVKWVNKPGSGRGQIKIKESDRKKVLSKYGARLRSVSGVKHATRSAPPSVSAPATTSAPPPMKKNASIVEPFAEPSTMEESWNALIEARKDTPRNQVENEWFDIIKNIHGEKQPDEITPEGWGLVKQDIDKIDKLLV